MTFKELKRKALKETINQKENCKVSIQHTLWVTISVGIIKWVRPPNDHLVRVPRKSYVGWIPRYFTKNQRIHTKNQAFAIFQNSAYLQIGNFKWIVINSFSYLDYAKKEFIKPHLKLPTCITYSDVITFIIDCDVITMRRRPLSDVIVFR